MRTLEQRIADVVMWHVSHDGEADRADCDAAAKDIAALVQQPHLLTPPEAAAKGERADKRKAAWIKRENRKFLERRQ